MHSGTVMCDGWDDIERNHLINFLTGTAKGVFFEGTVQLTSDQHEDADMVASLLMKHIEREGELNIIQVRTAPAVHSLSEGCECT